MSRAAFLPSSSLLPARQQRRQQQQQQSTIGNPKDRSGSVGRGCVEVPHPSVSHSIRAKTSSSRQPSLLLRGHGGHAESQVLAEIPPQLSWVMENPVLQSPVFWSSIIMLSIVGLLVTWEESIRTAKARLPPALLPVVDSMLAEMGGLGFIGLFLGVVVIGGPFGAIIGEFSERFLGDEEILLETFEFLHTAFFEVGVGFFTIAGLTVAKVIRKIDSLQEVSSAVFDVDGDGEVTLDEIADVLNVKAIDVDLDGDGVLTEEEIHTALRIAPKPTFFDELFMSNIQINGEALVVRERLIQSDGGCPIAMNQNFRIENYFIKIFGKNLEEIVELSPLTWLPLIPAISLGRAVDMSRDIVSASSPNALDSSGYFLGSPLFFGVSSAFALLTACWGLWNFQKMVRVKEMLLPTLVRDGKHDGEATLLPPRYEDKQLLEEFNSSPGIIGWIESFFAEPAANNQDKLFGVAGAAGPDLYRNSIKFHTWLAVSQIIFWGGQIFARDANALILGIADRAGNPELVVPEMLVFGFYSAVALAEVYFLAPQTFLNYCLVTSIEELVEERALEDACAVGYEENNQGETTVVPQMQNNTLLMN